MSVVNAVTIIAENLQSANISTGGVTTFTVVANQVTVSTGNITANSTVLKLDNTTSPIFNTAINTTSISTAAINLNSVQYTSIAPSAPAQPLVDYQVFTAPAADNKWYKPSWATANDVVTIQVWGGGGGGTSNNSRWTGGGGGACVIVSKLAGELNAVCNVIVGAGGLGTNATLTSPALSGQSSIFYTNSTFSITAPGGAGAWINATAQFGGGGGGYFSAGISNTGTGGSPIGGVTGATATDSTFGGGGGANGTSSQQGGSSVYGGGGGGILGGRSIYGGGGGGSGSGGLGGVSVFGGNGGNGTFEASAPGGGGGAEFNGIFKNGARGEVRITTTKSAIGGDATPTYSLTANSSSLYRNESALFTVTTFNVANGTTLHYTLNNSSTATSADFTTAVNGSIVINGGSNTFTLTANANASESFFMDLRTGSATGPIVANSSTINVGVIEAVYNGFVFPDITNSPTTWTAAPIGTADTNRRVVVALYQRQATDGSATASAVTVGGVSASLLVSRNDDARGHVDIWSATVSSGTTANIVVDWNNDGGDAKLVSSYSLYGANATVYSTGSNRVTGGGFPPVSANVNVIAGGFVIAIAGADNPGGSATTTFTAGVDVDNNGSTLARGAVGWGSKSITATQTDYTVTATTTDGADRLLAVASFQPG